MEVIGCIYLKIPFISQKFEKYISFNWLNFHLDFEIIILTFFLGSEILFFYEFGVID